MVAGAERQRGLDLDADVVGLDAAAVVRAMHDKAAGAHRRQAGEALLDPVGCRYRREGKGSGSLFSSRVRELRAQGGFIGRIAEVDRHLPTPVFALERRADGIVAVENLAEMCRQPPGGRLVAGQAGNGGAHGRSVQRLVKPLAMVI